MVVNAPVKLLCSRAKCRQMLTNYVLRNSARILEDVVNKFSDHRLKFLVCHMRVTDIENGIVRRPTVFHTRRIWTADRFWVLHEDYPFFLIRWSGH
jgi:hypothetical protein